MGTWDNRWHKFNQAMDKLLKGLTAAENALDIIIVLGLSLMVAGITIYLIVTELILA